MKVIKELTSLTIITVLLISVLSPSFVQAKPEDEMQNEQKVIVSYKNEQGKQNIYQYATKVHTELEAFDAVTVTLPQVAISKLEDDPNIRYIQRKEPINLLGTPAQWNVEDINAPKAWEQGYTGEGIKVAVIDTGGSNHRELSFVERHSFLEDVKETTHIDESSVEDHDGHGTHVAGIIGAKEGSYQVEGADVVGVAHGADLYSLKVKDQNEGNLIDVIEAIHWAIANNMDIINLSLGTKNDTPILKDAVDKAYSEGILVIAASGNDGNDSPVQYPARYESVIAVSSVDHYGNLSTFSSTGASVEFSAPGSGEKRKQVISTYPAALSQYGYAAMGGTSQASPHVAGFLALLKQKNPIMSANELRAELQKYVDDLGPEGRDSKYGYGKINYLAYNEKDQTPPAEVRNLTFSNVTTNVLQISYKLPSDQDFANVRIYVDGELKGETEKNLFRLTQLTPDTSYNIQIHTVDHNGNVSDGVTKRMKTNPLSEVTNFQVIERTPNSIKVFFQPPNREDLKSVNLYMNGKLVANTKYSIFNATGLTPNKTYNFVAKTVYATNHESQGVSVTATTEPTQYINRIKRAVEEVEEKPFEALTLSDLEVVETGEVFVSPATKEKMKNFKESINLKEIDAGNGLASKLHMNPEKNINFNFNVAMNPESVNEGEGGNVFVRHKGQFVEDIDIEFSENGKVITIIPPKEGYEPGEYFLYLDTSIKSYSGVKIENPMVVNFSIN